MICSGSFPPFYRAGSIRNHKEAYRIWLGYTQHKYRFKMRLKDSCLQTRKWGSIRNHKEACRV